MRAWKRVSNAGNLGDSNDFNNTELEGGEKGLNLVAPELDGPEIYTAASSNPQKRTMRI